MRSATRPWTATQTVWAARVTSIGFSNPSLTMPAMLLTTPIASVIVALFLPETASRELEEISPEREVS